MKWLVRAVIVALGSMVVQAIGAAALLRPTPPGAPSDLALVLVSNLLAASLYVFLAERSPARRGRLVVFLLVVAFGIPAIYLVEAVFFDIGIPAAELLRMYVFALLVGLGNAVLAALVTGKLAAGESGPLEAHPLPWGRLVLSAFSYVVFYFAAGILAWPFLKSFYEGRAMPSVGYVALLQVFRGAALSLVAWLVARHEPGSRMRAALSAGLTLSLIGGVVPLMVPNNPFMPDAVRYVHLVEVGISNFLFGALAVWWTWRRGPKAAALPGSPALAG